MTAVHVVGLAVLVLFTLGFWSRLTSILALVVILSDVHRGPMLTSQFEPVLTMVMCYLCLGPSGASWSLDRRWPVGGRRRRWPGRPPRARTPSWAATVSIRLDPGSSGDADRHDGSGEAAGRDLVGGDRRSGGLSAGPNRGWSI